MSNNFWILWFLGDFLILLGWIFNFTQCILRSTKTYTFWYRTFETDAIANMNTKDTGVSEYMFQVRQTEEMINKTFRLPQSLLDELTKIAEHEKVSVNNLVKQCCEYALANMKAEK